MGAIMLNPAMDKCLLVKSWGSNGAWGFPRGKISTGEADVDCARREVGHANSLSAGPACTGPAGRITPDHTVCTRGMALVNYVRTCCQLARSLIMSAQVPPAHHIYEHIHTQVLEETGYDLGDQLKEEDAIEVHLGQKRTKLYIVPGVDEATHFAPQVRKV